MVPLAFQSRTLLSFESRFSLLPSCYYIIQNTWLPGLPRQAKRKLEHGTGDFHCCYGLNCVSPKFTCRSSYPQWDLIWRPFIWTFVEVSNNKWGHKDRILIWWRWCPYNKRHQSSCSFSPSMHTQRKATWGHSKQVAVHKPGNELSPETKLASAFHHNSEKTHLLLKSVVFCYDRLCWLIQPPLLKCDICHTRPQIIGEN